MVASEIRAARVLVVEDDREIAELIAAYLQQEGLDPVIVGCAEDAVVACDKMMPELVMLDLGLPGTDGITFLKVFREKSKAPVIIVSARESDEDKVLGLELGADDFVSKPFSPRVLVARAKAHLRRSSSVKVDTPARLAFGPYVIDFEGKCLEKGDKRVPLSRREFELLAFLASHEGKTYKPEQIFGAVWGLEHGDLSTVAVHVLHLRQKLEEGNPPRWLVTVPGHGYRFLSGAPR